MNISHTDQSLPRPLRLLGELPRDAADEAYRLRHPEPTVLLLMRFETARVLRSIDDAVRAACARHGREVVRADDRDWTGELWANVALCLHNSDLVIAVLEDVEESRCDANVMVELGFALAAGRRCLILVEKRRPVLPAVLRHRLSRSFDIHELPGSVEQVVEDWLMQQSGSGRRETEVESG